MDRNSYLDPSLLISKCESAITQLEKDIDDYNGLKSNLDTIVNDEELKGNSITALKNNLSDYYICIGLALTADEKDLSDLETLKNRLHGEQIYDGSVIVDKYEKAESDRISYENKADEARAKERSWSPGWYCDEFGNWHEKDESNPYTSLVKHYEEMTGLSIQLRDIYKAKMDAFDSIEASTSGLVASENGTRKSLYEILKLMYEKKGDNPQVSGIAKEYLEKLDFSDDKNREMMKDLLDSECGQYLMDPAFFEDEDVKELEDLKVQIRNLEQQIANTNNSTAQEEMKKALAQFYLDEKELIQSILEKTDHADDFLAAYEFMDGRGYSVDELEALMWQWVTIDQIGTDKEFLFPESWLDQLDHDYKIALWTITDNPPNAYGLFEGKLDYEVVCMLINGSGDTDAEKEYYKEMAVQMSEDDSFRDLVYKVAFLYAMAGRTEEVYFSDDMLDALGGLKESIIAMASDQELTQNTAELVGYNILEGCMNLDKKILEGLDFLTGGQLPFIQDQIDLFNDSIASLDTWEGENQNEIFARLKDILRNLSGENVNDLYDLLVRVPGLNTMSPEEIIEHYEHNIDGWNTFQSIYSYSKLDPSIVGDYYPYGPNTFYIENQNQMLNYFYYGKYMNGVTEEFMGSNYENNDLLGNGNLCEVISVYNVITFMENENADFPAIIKDFESKAPALGGNYGTAPNHAKEYLELMGYDAEEVDVSSLSHDPNGVDDFDALLNEYDAFILSDWNGDTADQAMHTMAITVEKNIDPLTGDYTYNIVRHNDQGDYGYTSYSDSEGLYSLLCEYTNNGSTDDGSLMITGIRK